MCGIGLFVLGVLFYDVGGGGHLERRSGCGRVGDRTGTSRKAAAGSSSARRCACGRGAGANAGGGGWLENAPGRLRGSGMSRLGFDSCSNSGGNGLLFSAKS